MARKINPHPPTDWRRWYASYEWRRRAHRQMANEPLCAMCLAEGRVVPAEVADHVERVDGDYTRFPPGQAAKLV